MTVGDNLDAEFASVHDRIREVDSGLTTLELRHDQLAARIAALESSPPPNPDPDPDPEPPPPPPPPPSNSTTVATAAELTAAIAAWPGNRRPILCTNNIAGTFTVAGPERTGLVLNLGGNTLKATSPADSWVATLSVTDGANNVVVATGAVELHGQGDGRAIIQGARMGHRNTDGLLLSNLTVRSGDMHGCAVQTFGPAGGGIIDLDTVRIEPIPGQYMARSYRWGGHALGVFKIGRNLSRPMRWNKVIVTGVRQHVISSGIGANCATDGNAVHAGDLCTGRYHIDITDSSFTDADGGGVIFYKSPLAVADIRRSVAQRCGLLTGPGPYCTATAALQSDSGLIIYDAESIIQSVKGNVRKV